ncbi:MAG: lasso peptide biosynthesis B2 protein [Candidatus Dormibacteraeota bacterium]|nr:lasso peptide biosynthesis B2 protein [Candidatus Dormibacteraeota bacterium]
MRKFWALPPSERRLLVVSLVLVGLIRVALSLMSLQRVRGLLEGVLAGAVGRAPDLSSVPPGRLHWAVAAASRTIPGTRCLPRAIALEGLLKAAGIHSRLRVGVAVDADRMLSAHAWVETDEAVFDMGGENRQFVPLPPF